MATGKSETGLFCSYVVARYRPPGDFIGEYKENVPKGEFNKDICAKLDEMVKNITKGISYCNPFVVCYLHCNLNFEGLAFMPL